MFTQHDFRILRKRVEPYRAYIPSLPVFSAGVIAILGAGLLLAWPDAADETASASGSADTQNIAFDESGCDKQTWPYVDVRCAQRAEQAREARKVRVVTDRGTEVTVVTPMPKIEPKRAPAPVANPKPVVAQDARPIGPPAAPQAAESAPQAVATAGPAKPEAKPEPARKIEPAVATAPPAAVNAMAMERSAAITSAQASSEPAVSGVNAFAEEKPGKKSRAQKQAEKREAQREAKAKREARRQRNDDDLPDDVVASARSLPSGGESRKKARRGGVPDEVIAAVEAAAARDRGAEYGGQRVIYLRVER